MSWQAVTWVLENSEATLGSRLVMLSIASHANREGTHSHPSYDTLAQETLLSRSQVLWCVKQLEANGHLIVERDGPGRGNLNYYTVVGVAEWLEIVSSKRVGNNTIKNEALHKKVQSAAQKGSIDTEEVVPSQQDHSPKGTLVKVPSICKLSQDLDPKAVFKELRVLFRRRFRKTWGSPGSRYGIFAGAVKEHGADVVRKAFEVWLGQCGEGIRNMNWPFAVFVKQLPDFIEEAQEDADLAAEEKSTSGLEAKLEETDNPYVPADEDPRYLIYSRDPEKRKRGQELLRQRTG